MEITYENHGNYYIFSDSLKTRVYLGEISPEDYIHDQIHQEKRSASGYYFNKETKEEFDELPDGEISGHKYEYDCKYDFNRKTSLAMMGSPRGNCKYDKKNPVMKRFAEAYFFNDGSLEKYDAHQKEFAEEQERQKRKDPALYNLMGVGGRMYYVDDEGKEITIDEHHKRMKAELGEDCFDKAAEKIDPKIRELVEGIMKMERTDV